MRRHLQFLSDGLSEIKRKISRARLRSRLKQLDSQREQALTALGRRSWELRTDLSGFSDLRDQLAGLDQRAGELAATLNRLQTENAALQSERAATLARFDAISKPVLAEKSAADSTLRAARARLNESDRAIGGLEASLGKLSAELARADETARQRLQQEQQTLTEQLAAARTGREPVSADVVRLEAESSRCAAELTRIDGERKAALSPIDAALKRVAQESRDATSQSSSVDREQTARFTQLGGALYDARIERPDLTDSVQAVTAIDAARSEARTALDDSLTTTGNMPRLTMVKFWAVPVLCLVLIVGLASVAGTWFAGPSPRDYARETTTDGVDQTDMNRAVMTEESQKDAVVNAFLRSPQDPSKRGQAVEILKADLLRLGSSTSRSYLPQLMKVLSGGEPELRAAAAHAIGMMRPRFSEAPALRNALNDPVPSVRTGALAALGEFRDQPVFRLLLVRARAADTTSRRRAEEIRPDPVPTAKELRVPIIEGATFLHYASDRDLGRAAFTHPAPADQVLAFYTSKAGRAAVDGQEFSRIYFGGSPADPTGASRLGSEMQAWFQRAMADRKPEAEIRAQSDRYAGRMQNLPLMRYADSTLFGSPSFVALEEVTEAGEKKVVRYVVVFHDRSLEATAFEVHSGNW